jgi:hypothetical protein
MIPSPASAAAIWALIRGGGALSDARARDLIALVSRHGQLGADSGRSLRQRARGQFDPKPVLPETPGAARIFAMRRLPFRLKAWSRSSKRTTSSWCRGWPAYRHPPVRPTDTRSGSGSSAAPARALPRRQRVFLAELRPRGCRPDEGDADACQPPAKTRDDLAVGRPANVTRSTRGRCRSAGGRPRTAGVPPVRSRRLPPRPGLFFIRHSGEVAELFTGNMSEKLQAETVVGGRLLNRKLTIFPKSPNRSVALCYA